jgi:hypothetical protein
MMASNWSAIFPAIAALAGVALGQLWQGRREDKRWEREHALERERRSDQRERDKEIWAREDRARFTDQKREVYAEYQTAAYRISVLIVDADADYVKVAQAAPGERLDRLAFFSGHRFSDDFRHAYDDLRIIRNQVRLVAPPEVTRLTAPLDGVLISAIEIVLQGQSADVKVLWSNLRRARFDLLDAMRLDLDPESQPLSRPGHDNFVPDADAVQWPE